MKTKKLLLTFSLLLTAASAMQAQNVWNQKANYGGGSLGECCGFGTASEGYIMLGYDGSSYYKTVYAWNQSTNTWTQKGNYPGAGTRAASAVEIGGNAFVISGQTSSGFTTQVWEYFPATDSWTQKASFPGSGRYRGFAVADSVHNKIYYGCGDDLGPNYLSDFWVYDVASNTWTQEASFAGGGRSGPCGFFLNGFIYWGTGNNGDLTYDATHDWWKYDPSGNSWTQVTGLPRNAQRRHGQTFTLLGKGYVMLGDSSAPSGTGFLTDLWMYDPTADTWTQKANYPGVGAAISVGFEVGNKGYCGTGATSVAYTNQYYEYAESGLGINEVAENCNILNLYPNPARASITISFTNMPAHNSYYTIYNSLGQEVVPNTFIKDQNVNINLNGLANGLYILKVTGPNGQTIRKFTISN